MTDTVENLYNIEPQVRVHILPWGPIRNAKITEHRHMNNRHDHSKRLYRAPEGKRETWGLHCRLGTQTGISWIPYLALAFSSTLVAGCAPWSLPRLLPRARSTGRETAKRGRAEPRSLRGILRRRYRLYGRYMRTRLSYGVVRLR